MPVTIRSYNVGLFSGPPQYLIDIWRGGDIVEIREVVRVIPPLFNGTTCVRSPERIPYLEVLQASGHKFKIGRENLNEIFDMAEEGEVRGRMKPKIADWCKRQDQWLKDHADEIAEYRRLKEKVFV